MSTVRPGDGARDTTDGEPNKGDPAVENGDEVLKPPGAAVDGGEDAKGLAMGGTGGRGDTGRTAGERTVEGGDTGRSVGEGDTGETAGGGDVERIVEGKKGGGRKVDGSDAGLARTGDVDFARTGDGGTVKAVMLSAVASRDEEAENAELCCSLSGADTTEPR